MLHSPFTPLQNLDPPIRREQMNLTFNPFKPIDEGKCVVFAEFMDDTSKVDHDMHGRYSVYMKEDNLTHPKEKNKISPRDWIDSINDTLQMYVSGDTANHSRAWKDVDYLSLSPSEQIWTTLAGTKGQSAL
ncbi:hypothetical protein FNV43_RR03582 [Rhamnella rubrinervis]|uniref:Uncharacterized protein n=1 Tax=Rhamnella rubrinervis TaxID=2594499 RepID=A0A8K0HIN7_9ROSA|nr:hypothetical protein FNV43_RR03582 [Rhamnella rubrinervis]